MENYIMIITQIVSLAGMLTGGFVSVSKVFEGQRCLLRSEMLRIYYRNQERKTIRQYEYENFMAMYAAYKKLHGNSFIDKIKKEIDEEWTVIS